MHLKKFGKIDPEFSFRFLNDIEYQIFLTLYLLMFVCQTVLFVEIHFYV